MSEPQGRSWTIHGIHRQAGPGGRCHFRVTLGCGADGVADVHLEASELLDYRAFRRHVLETSGRLVRFAEVETAADPAAAWLDLVETALPDEPMHRPAAAGFHPSPPPRRGRGQEAVASEMADIGGGD